MASVENKLRVLLADLEITQHLLQIFDECGIDFHDLLSITADKFRASLEPTKINWKYPVLQQLVSSWRTRNESQIADFLKSLEQPYRLRLTGEVSIIPFTSTAVSSDTTTITTHQFATNGPACEFDSDVPISSNSFVGTPAFIPTQNVNNTDDNFATTSVTGSSTSMPPEYVLTPSTVHVKAAAAADSKAVKTADAYSLIKTTLPLQTSNHYDVKKAAASEENELRKLTELESIVIGLPESLEITYTKPDDPPAVELNTAPPLFAPINTTSQYYFVGEQIYKVEARDESDPDYTAASTSARNGSDYTAVSISASGSSECTAPVYVVNSPDSANVTDGTCDTNDSITSISGNESNVPNESSLGICQPTEDGKSLNEAEQCQQKVLFNQLYYLMPLVLQRRFLTIMIIYHTSAMCFQRKPWNSC
ncbi:uncharacterized protein LOC134215980 isoform X2 [Armigeres subalbatus]|uniref:uncharacterized protein LOC134215980 isoform X2 n=1 Tax=Armigeres subalbatus TaxID=124917 RepID=UPI002ED11F56